MDTTPRSGPTHRPVLQSAAILGDFSLPLLHMVLQLRAAAEDALALGASAQQFFTLHVDDVTCIGHPPLGLADTAFQLGACDLRVRQFLAP